MPNEKKRILIVEDEPTLVEVLKDKLELSKYEVLKAGDGAVGLKKALAEKPDLILLDLVMPNMDGMTMLEKLREDSWGKKVPVIILTNLTSVAETKEAMKKGVNDYLIKSDWALEDLLEKISITLS